MHNLKKENYSDIQSYLLIVNTKKWLFIVVTRVYAFLFPFSSVFDVFISILWLTDILIEFARSKKLSQHLIRGTIIMNDSVNINQREVNNKIKCRWVCYTCVRFVSKLLFYQSEDKTWHCLSVSINQYKILKNSTVFITYFGENILCLLTVEGLYIKKYFFG